MCTALVYSLLLHLFVEITPDESALYKDIQLFQMCNEIFLKTNPVAAAALFVGTVSSACLVRVRGVHQAL